MSSSLVAAAAAGIVIGIGGTLVLSKPNNGPPPRSSPAPAPLSPSPVPTLGGPGAGAAPPSVYNGGLTMSSGLVQPGSVGPVSDFLKRAAYITAYDRRNRIPAWTAQHLTAASLRPPTLSDGTVIKGDRQNSTFREDESVPPMFRAHLLDYFRSGYDRGHMVPAADAKISQTAMDETFLLTNIAPQVGEGFNRHYWAYVEAFCRNLTNQFEDVYVFTVPLFLPKQSSDGKWRVTYEMIAPQNAPPTIAVPTHFAKVILASRPPRSPVSKITSALTHSTPSSSSSSLLTDKEWSLGAFVLPNAVIPDEARLESFVVPVESVELSAGLTLFPDAVKAVAKPLCQTTSCQVIVRRFDDSVKKNGGGGGGGKGGRKFPERSATL